MPIPLLRSAVAGVLLALLVAAPAVAETERASSGQVTATFTYRKTHQTRFHGLRLRVARAGKPAFDAVVRVHDCHIPNCSPAGALVGRRSLRVLDFDGDGEPEILADVYTGGAHCCTVTELLRWTGSRYAVTRHDWGDGGYALARNGQRPEFVTGDDRFAYAFAAYAFSALPVQVIRYDHGRWRDVTRAHAETLRAEARRLAKAYRRQRDGLHALGILAAWVADEYRLGRRAQAGRFLAGELRAGRLQSEPEWPAGRAFLRELRRSLRAWGYAR